MEVKFNDVIPISRGDKENREETRYHVDIKKCEEGIQDISIYSSGSFMGGFLHFKSVDEWDKIKNAMDRLIIKAQEYSI